jgi:hypothetical protein
MEPNALVSPRNPHNAGGSGTVGALAARVRSQAYVTPPIVMVAGIVTGMISVATLMPGLVMTLTAPQVAAQTPGVEAAAQAVGLSLLVLAAVGVVCGFSLLRQRAWSWPGAVVVCALQAMVGLLRFAVHEPVLGPILAIGISGAALYYLFRRDVRAAFGRD